MKNTKRRNHYIPKLLLKRFASRHVSQNDQYFVWQLSSRAKPIEVNIKNVAVGNFFYGKGGNSVEDDFVPHEGRLATVLNSLDAGTPPDVHAEDLRVCIWTQTVRTAALRAQFTKTLERMLAQIGKGIRASERRI